jgi:two-component system sensor histidine kinase YesM
MPLRKIMFPASIFVQLIIIFLVVVIPLYALGTQVYTWANDVVKRGITETAGSQVDFYIDNLDMDITRMKALQYDLIFDEDLNQLAAIPESLNEIEKIMAILRLQKRLLTIRHSNNLIEDVHVYIPSINKTIQSGDVKELDASEMNKTLDQWLNVGPKLVFHQHKAALVTQKLDKFGESTFVIAIMLSKDKLRNQLMMFEQNRDSGLLLTDLNGSVYLTTVDEAALMESLRKFEFRGTGQASANAIEHKMNGYDYIFIQARSDKLGINLYKFILQDDIFTELKRYQFWFVLFTGLAIVLILLFSFTTYKLIKRPLGKLIRAFRILEEGDLDIQIRPHRRNDEFNFLYTRFNLMVNRLKQMMEQVYLQRILAQRSELKHLQSQITPHFLYNSFFILSNMVESEDHENAKLFSRQLGEYLRFVTRNSSSEVVLAEEVKHARTYAELQARRFRKRIELFFEQFPDEWGHVFVPRLIIQPIIENVFEHGLAHKTEGGHVSITFRREENEQNCALVVAIEDNGDELAEGRLYELQSQLNNYNGEIEVTGLINVHQRLRLKFGESYGLELAIGQSGGLRVIIKIPRGR